VTVLLSDPESRHGFILFRNIFKRGNRCLGVCDILVRATLSHLRTATATFATQFGNELSYDIPPPTAWRPNGR